MGGIHLRQAPTGEAVYGDAAGQALVWDPDSGTWEPGPVLGPGIYHVDNFGAVPLLRTTTPIPGDEAAFRANNTASIQAALDYVTTNGGTLLFGPGIYYTDSVVGWNVAADTNLSLTLQGLGPWPTIIWSNSHTLPCFWIQTTSGNIRNLYMKDLGFRDGRTGLSLYNCNYCTFDRLFFWGSDEFGLQDYLGFFNVFDKCYFTESGARGDAAYFISSGDQLTNSRFGELCGGVVVDGGNMLIDGGIMYGMAYRGKNGFDYITSTVLSLASLQTGVGAAFNCLAGQMQLCGINGGPNELFVKLHSAFTCKISNCQLETGKSPASPAASFEGWVKFTANPAGRCALNIQDCQFYWHSTSLGYFISETGATLHHAVIVAQLQKDSTATITAIGTSSPSLLNPAGEGNFVVAPIFNTVF